MKLEGAIGSCTEEVISHVLSERFNRNLMGWTKAGLEKMLMIRVFTQKIEAKDIEVDKRG